LGLGEDEESEEDEKKLAEPEGASFKTQEAAGDGPEEEDAESEEAIEED